MILESIDPRQKNTQENTKKNSEINIEKIRRNFGIRKKYQNKQQK